MRKTGHHLILYAYTGPASVSYRLFCSHYPFFFQNLAIPVMKFMSFYAVQKTIVRFKTNVSESCQFFRIKNISVKNPGFKYSLSFSASTPM